MVYYDEHDDNEDWYNQLNERLRNQRFRDLYTSDEPDCKQCAIEGCDKPATRTLSVTLRGIERDKRFCCDHAYDQSQGEQLYRMGM